jgi:hypothetical protein
VIDRQHAIKQHRALDRVQAQILGKEVEILLSAIGAHGEVMIAADQAHDAFLRLLVGTFCGASLRKTLGSFGALVDKKVQNKYNGLL